MLPREIASEAALIATFYGTRDGAPDRLHERLYRSLLLESGTDDVPAEQIPLRWRWKTRKNPAMFSTGHRFEPLGRAASDTTAVQLALNAPGGAAKAWKNMRQELAEALDDKALDGIWGYTLVYQAVLKEGVDDPNDALDELIGSIEHLDLAQSPQSTPLLSRRLAEASVPDGWVWLLGIPNRGPGLEAATVYCALGPPEKEAALVDMFYGPAAELLHLDLIAHKGYYHMRQYRGEDLESRYDASLEKLGMSASQLHRELEGRQVTSPTLDELFRTYNRLVPVVSGLKRLHIAMRQQSKNYDKCRERLRRSLKNNDVVECHRDQLETAVFELELMVEPLEDALETADKAVSAAQVLVDRETEQGQKRREWRLTYILTMAGLALSLAELLDYQQGRELWWVFQVIIVLGAWLVFLGVAILLPQFRAQRHAP